MGVGWQLFGALDMVRTGEEVNMRVPAHHQERAQQCAAVRSCTPPPCGPKSAPNQGAMSRHPASPFHVWLQMSILIPAPRHRAPPHRSCTLGWSHTQLGIRERYSHLLRPIHSKMCSREGSGQWYIYAILEDDQLIGNFSVLPAINFE